MNLSVNFCLCYYSFLVVKQGFTFPLGWPLSGHAICWYLKMLTLVLAYHCPTEFQHCTGLKRSKKSYLTKPRSSKYPLLELEKCIYVEEALKVLTVGCVKIPHKGCQLLGTSLAFLDTIHMQNFQNLFLSLLFFVSWREKYLNREMQRKFTFPPLFLSSLIHKFVETSWVHSDSHTYARLVLLQVDSVWVDNKKVNRELLPVLQEQPLLQ